MLGNLGAWILSLGGAAVPSCTWRHRARPNRRRPSRPRPPQLPLLKARWKQVLFGALFQYVHGIFTQLAHRMHQPQAQPLGDLGFKYLPVGAPSLPAASL